MKKYLTYSKMVLNKHQLFSFFLKFINIFALLCIVSIRREYLIAVPEKNSLTGVIQTLPNKDILVLSSSIVTWTICFIYKMLQRVITKNIDINIPINKSLISGGLIFLSYQTYSQGLIRTSYQTATAIKSLNILSVLIVAIYYPKPKQQSLILNKKKIYIGVLASLGIFLSFYFDPEKDILQRLYQLNGVILLFVSVISDGLFYDYQAHIKSEIKPTFISMMYQVNKWVAIIIFFYIIILKEPRSSFQYAYYHPSFAQNLLIFSLVSCASQFFIYRTIFKFRQHIAPFFIVTRDLITLFGSLIYYNHKTSKLQILGYIIVLCTLILEFRSELISIAKDSYCQLQKKQNDHKQIQTVQIRMQQK